MSTNTTGLSTTTSPPTTTHLTFKSGSSLTMSQVPATSTTPAASTTTVATTSSAAAAASTTTTTIDTSSLAASVSSVVLSSARASTTTVPAASTADVTSIVSASSVPPTTRLITSIITQTGTGAEQTSIPPVTVIVTAETTPTQAAGTSSTSATSTAGSTAALQNPSGASKSSGGLPPAGKTAIAVVVPIVAVALLVLAALFFWRKRKQRKNAEEARRKEVEEYAYNPNNDPTLPAVAADGSSEMAEDHGSGYRGWGTAGAMSARKPSTTLSGGHTRGQLSDGGSNPGGFSQSPTAVGTSDGQQGGDMYTKNRDTMNSDDLAALGAAPAASNNQQGNVRRGPSNASSSYSAGHRSDHSDPSLNQRGPADGAVSPQSYGYNTTGPYGDGSYGGGDAMPVVRDNPARRNTRIEQGGAYSQSASGISQNF